MCDPILIHPLPVNDTLFFNGNRSYEKIEGLFLGRVSEYRNQFLMPLKHFWDWTVIDHGMMNISLDKYFNLSLNLHSESYPNFENRIFLHMAQKMVVITQSLLPTWGLIKNKHYLEFQTVEELIELVDQLQNQSKIGRAHV